jgi:hypothetical protein
MADNWQLKAVLSANAAGLIKTLDSVNKATRSTRKHLADIGSGSLKLAGNLALPVGLLSSLAAGFSLLGIKRAVTNFAELGDEVAKSAQRIGVSIPEYQRLKYVAGQSGVDVTALGDSVGRLNKGIAEAAVGKNKDLAGLFAKAGISMRGANGELRAGADLLPEVADLFERNGNAAVQARIGNALFGKSWQTLAPLLQGGSDGIRQLEQRYKMLGIEVESGAIKAGEAFGDQMDDLDQVTRSYGNTITAKLLPALSPLLEKTIQWAVANRDVITTQISTFVTQFAESMAKVDWNAVIDGIGSLVKGLKDLVDWFGGTKNALIALVIFMNLQGISAFVGLMGSVFKLGGSLFTLATTQIPAAILKMGGLEAAMGKAAFGAGKLLGTMGQIGLVAGAGWAGWEVGKLLNEYVINPAAAALTGDKEATLGTALYGAFNADPMAQMDAADKKASLVRSANRVQASGAINVNFQNAPPGMRFEQEIAGSDIPINTSVGYRSFATGMPG